MLNRDVLSDSSSSIRFRVKELSLTPIVVIFELHAQSSSFELAHLVALATKQQSKMKTTSNLARSRISCKSNHISDAPSFRFACQILRLGRYLLRSREP